MSPLSNLGGAIRWFRLGFQVMPVVSGEKRPAKKFDHWLGNLSEQAIDDHWTKHPYDEVGCILGDSLIVFDADTPMAVVALCQIEEAFDFKPNLIVQTIRGEHHYGQLEPGTYVRSDSHDTEKHPERIDIKHGRALVVGPTSEGRSIQLLEIDSADELSVVGQDFIDAIFRHNSREAPRPPSESRPPPQKSKAASENLKLIKSLLPHIDPDCGYDDWNRIAMAIHYETGGGQDGFDLFDEWSRRGDKYPGCDALEQRWKSFRTDCANPVTLRSIYKIAKDNGADIDQIRAEANLDRQSCNQNSNGPEGSTLLTPSVITSRTTVDSIESVDPLDPEKFPNKRYTQRGEIRLPATVVNIRHLLDGYGIQVNYDVIAKKPIIRIPGLSGCPDNIDNSTLTHVVSLATLNEIADKHVPAIVDAIADTRQVNPVAVWILSKPWDGMDRLPAFYDTLRVQDSFPVSLKKVILFRWLLSAVAAAFMPIGFRCRGVLVLQGPQSIGKTTWILVLVSDPLLRDRVVLLDHHLDAGNKDSKFTAIGYWIVEIGELDSSFKKDIALLKGFITSGRDTGRRPFARRDSEYQRRTVYCATVNRSEFLVDDSGNTRFWTIPVTSVNYEHGIDMQQLWAQVYDIYQRGTEQWHLTPEEEAELERHNRGHRSVTAIRDLLESKLDFSADESRWKRMTATDLLDRLDILNPSNAQARECGAFLREKLV